MDPKLIIKYICYYESLGEETSPFYFYAVGTASFFPVSLCDL